MSRAMPKPSPPRRRGRTRACGRPGATPSGAGRWARAGAFSSTRITSRASSTGPMPLPTGWRPSVMTDVDRQVHAPGDVLEQLAQPLRLGHRTHLGGRSDGMSSSRWVEPAATFFDRMDATIWPGESIDSGRSTEISTSSAGDSAAVPPQARQPRCSRTISDRRAIGSSTLERLHGVGGACGRCDRARGRLGHSMPCAATMGTTSIDRFRGCRSMQCLSAAWRSCQSRRWPTAAIDYGQEVHLLAVQLALVRGDDEGRQFDLRITVLGDVAHDARKSLRSRRIAGDLRGAGPGWR